MVRLPNTGTITDEHQKVFDNANENSKEELLIEAMRQNVQQKELLGATHKKCHS